MSFTSAMMSGVSGLRANDTALNVIGNNIANVNTAGFKSGRTLFEDMLSKSVDGPNSQIGLGSSVGTVQNQFTQGGFLSAANVTDMAINGDGFFAVQDNSTTSTTKFTRDGTFSVDATGKYLVNPNGDKLCDTTGAVIDLTKLPSSSTINKIAADGTIGYLDASGAQQTSTIKIGIARFNNPDGLEKTGNNDFRATTDSGASVIAAANQDTTILSNNLEVSNVDMTTQLTSMITTQRAYSANSKSVTTSDEMTKTVINLKQ